MFESSYFKYQNILFKYNKHHNFIFILDFVNLPNYTLDINADVKNSNIILSIITKRKEICNEQQ